MAAMDFPASPTNGQNYVAPGGGPTYVFNGTAWTQLGTGSPFVLKAGDRMTGGLTVAPALPVAGSPAQVVAGTLASSGNLGLNLYLDAGATVWPRIAAGYGGVFQVDPASGSFNWFSGSTGAAGANATLTTPMQLSRDGNLTAYGTVTATLGVQLAANGTINSNTGTGIQLMNGGASRLYTNATGGGIGVNPTSGANAGVFVGIPTGTGAGVIATGPAAAGYAILGYCTGQSIFGSLGSQVSSQNWSMYGSASAYLGSGTWQSSDARLKNISLNKAAFDRPAVDIVAAVPIRSFTLKGPLREAPKGDQQQFGWIAQELEAVLPIAVVDVGIMPDDKAMRDFLPGVETIKAINHQYLIATLWQAVQELSTTNKALADRVAALEAV